MSAAPKSGMSRLLSRAVGQAQEPLRQPDIFERSLYLASEMLVLQHAAVVCATELEAGRSQRDFNRMRAALANIKKLHDHAALLNDSMQRVIDAENRRQGATG